MSTSDDIDSAGVADEDDRSPKPPARVDLNRSDERVLSYLVRNGADYPALIAGHTGLHVSYVERRIEVLAESGLIEAVSGETVYRITAAGRDVVVDA